MSAADGPGPGARPRPVVGDEAAEGDAGGGGADEVLWGGKAEEDFHQELVGDRRQGHLPASGQAAGGGGGGGSGSSH